MRKFSTSAYRFQMLQRGERAPNQLDDTGFCGTYLVWLLKSGFWDVRQFEMVNGSRSLVISLVRKMWHSIMFIVNIVKDITAFC